MGVNVSIIIPLKTSSFNADGVGNVLINGIKREQQEGGANAPACCWQHFCLHRQIYPFCCLVSLYAQIIFFPQATSDFVGGVYFICK